MDRNFLLAFLLSTLAIFGYYTLFPPEQPKPEKAQQQISSPVEQNTEQTNQAATVISESTAQQPAIQKEEATSRTTVKVETDLYAAEIDSLDGSLTQFMLKEYKYSLKPHFSITKFFFSLFSSDSEAATIFIPNRMVNLAGDTSDQNRIWKVFTGSDDLPVNYQVSNEALFVSSNPETLDMKTILPNGVEAYKRLTFYPGNYVIDLEIKLVNRTGESVNVQPKVNFGAGGEAISGESLPQPKRAISFIDEDFETYDGGDVEENVNFKNTLWAGVMDKYFITVSKTADGSTFNGELSPLSSTLDGKEIVVPKLVYVDDPLQLANNQEYVRKFKLFVGPKVERRLENFDYYLPQAMDLGWFEILARPLLAVLRWLQSYVVNWGVAIILLTIIVRTAMFPLAFKSMTSMRKMQALGPKINTLREKYKNNKERMNQEIMKFYGQNKVNPMGGCLPMLLQIPIFIALYQALLPAIELRHTPFFLIWSDLSASDYTLILPILMGISMFVQQNLTPTPTMDPTQAKIMKWMPVMMVLFFLNMPSGLVLYWVVSNIISIGQQLVFNRVIPRATADKADSGKSKPAGKKGKTGKMK
jgi:YidC/Oxa1 family membrane protein insertase